MEGEESLLEIILLVLEGLVYDSSLSVLVGL